ncbi:MAG: site-specific integrase, partial [Kiritimatiellaeota bacterium]|nr:site-specific integrase [Kiritimatiellota bacterium]
MKSPTDHMPGNIQKTAAVPADPCLAHFFNYLRGERDFSEHTFNAYRIDLAQFVAQQWGADGRPPFRWKEVDRYGARRFLAGLQKVGSAATSIGRKLSALRSFFRFLVRERHVDVNPFAGLLSPKKDKRLPQ